MNFAPIILGVIFIIFIMRSIKIAQENERFIVFEVGKLKGIKGPGLIFKIPGGIEEWVKLRLGDKGELLTEETARFHDKDTPVISFSKINIGSKVQIVGFENEKVKIELCADQTKNIKCEKCGHEMHI